MLDEIWKLINILPKEYEISTFGNVRKILPKLRSINSKYSDGYRPIKKQLQKNGYEYVNINGKKYFVHRLVFETFVGKTPKYYEIDHIDTNKSNNNLTNLRACIREENRNNPNTVQKMEQYKKPVEQYDLSGKLIAIYPSIHEAAKILGKNRQSISNCCRGKLKTAYGFMWKYKKLK